MCYWVYVAKMVSFFNSKLKFRPLEKMNAIIKEVNELKVHLEKALGNEDVGRTVDVLKLLHNQPCTVEILKVIYGRISICYAESILIYISYCIQETKIGILVNKIKSSSKELIKNDSMVLSLSSSLISKWKATAGTSSSSGGGSTPKSMSTTSSGTPRSTTGTVSSAATTAVNLYSSLIEDTVIIFTYI